MRSQHNNYITLPVLFIMVSNHYPMTFGHEFNWLVLIALSLIGAGARHYFNLKHRGQDKVWILPVAALAMVALAFVSKPKAPELSADADEITWAQIQPIIALRCQPCHSATPTFEGMTSPPQGVIYDSEEDVRTKAPMIMDRAILTHSMPPGNLTQITDEERKILGSWIQNLDQ